jgi:hypothetical protein
MLKILTLLFVTCLGLINLNGQAKSSNNCKDNFKGYITDPQQYIIKATEVTKFDMIFYAGFNYRLDLCCNNENIRLNFILIDEMGNTQYNNVISYGFSHNFNFETVFHGTIIIKPVKVDNNQAELIIGYKRI